MTVRALWLPYQVDDLDAARDFYTVHLGLSEVDSWDRAGERGSVLEAADQAFIELVAPGDTPGPAPLAFELADQRAVDAAFRPWSDRVVAPRRYPRGHYGFELRGPAGARVMVWSER